MNNYCENCTRKNCLCCKYSSKEKKQQLMPNLPMALLSSNVNQIPTSTTPMPITFNNNILMDRLKHFPNSSEIVFMEDGYYMVSLNANLYSPSIETPINAFIWLECNGIPVESSNNTFTYALGDSYHQLMLTTFVTASKGDILVSKYAVNDAAQNLGLYHQTMTGLPNIPSARINIQYFKPLQTIATH